jgi:hypothetical protein
LSRTFQTIDRGLTRLEERLRQGSHALGRRLLAASPARASRAASLDTQVAHFAKGRGADRLGPRHFLFHTGYGPVDVRIHHKTPRTAVLQSRFANKLGRARAHEDGLCNAHGLSAIASMRLPNGVERGFATWKILVRKTGASKAHSPLRPGLDGSGRRSPGRGQGKERQGRKPGVGWGQDPRRARGPMTRKTIEKLAWLRTPKNQRSSKEPVSVLMDVDGKPHLVPLSSLAFPTLKRYAKSVGVKA